MAARFGKRHSYVGWLGAILLVGILLLQTPLFTHTRHRAWDVLVSIVSRFGGIGTLTVSPDVAEQLQTLRAENIRLRAEEVDYRRLRYQLGSPAFADFRALPATVVGRPIDTFHSRLVLNRGTRDGVIIGSPVVVHGSVLIGFITDLSDRTSVVQLLVHPDTSLAAESIDAEHPGQGIVQGHQFTSAVFHTVPRDAPLHEGQEVVSLARPNVMPYGLVIGTINRLENQEYEPYQKAWLTLPYRLSTLTAVHILVLP